MKENIFKCFDCNLIFELKDTFIGKILKILPHKPEPLRCPKCGSYNVDLINEN